MNMLLIPSAIIPASFKSFYIRLFFLSCLFGMLLVGCQTTTAQTQKKTQLEIREFQTRVYPVSETKIVMKALLNALQDRGFIIENAVLDLGLISAEKHTNIENSGEAFMATLFAGANARWKKASIVDCTVNVSEFGEETRVRVNFQIKTLDNKGDFIHLKNIEDAKYYQDFFAEVDKSIFIEKSEV